MAFWLTDFLARSLALCISGSFVFGVQACALNELVFSDLFIYILFDYKYLYLIIE